MSMFYLASFVCSSARFREALAKHLHLLSDNNNIRHVKSDVVLLFLKYGFISAVGYYTVKTNALKRRVIVLIGKIIFFIIS